VTSESEVEARGGTAPPPAFGLDPVPDTGVEFEAPLTQVGDAVQPVARRASPARLAWGRFRQYRLAVASLVFVALLSLLALLAPLVAPYDPYTPSAELVRKPPSAEHLLGTDASGRDVLSRLIYGARVSLAIGFVAVAIYLVIGTVLGAVAGYSRGTVDDVIMRATDTVMAFPALIIIIAVVPILGPSIFNIMLVIGLLGWPAVCRLVRGQFLSLREREFVVAARSIGVRDREIVARHVLPHVAGPLIVIASLGVAEAIIAEAGLSLLGLGVQPPDPSWGQMLSQAIDVGTLLRRPWLWIPPALAIAVTVLAINFVGDGLRDALDPRGAEVKR
jgi:peptide/nickel transport system permease protein